MQIYTRESFFILTVRVLIIMIYSSFDTLETLE